MAGTVTGSGVVSATDRELGSDGSARSTTPARGGTGLPGLLVDGAAAGDGALPGPLALGVAAGRTAPAFATDGAPPALAAGAAGTGGTPPLLLLPARETATGAPGLASVSFGIGTTCASDSTLIVLVTDHGARPGARAVIV